MGGPLPEILYHSVGLEYNKNECYGEGVEALEREVHCRVHCKSRLALNTIIIRIICIAFWIVIQLEALTFGKILFIINKLL